MTIVVLFRCSLAVVAIRWNSSFLSGCLSFSFFLSFFVSFDYALVVSIVLPLYLREGKKKLEDENTGEDEECFPSFALSYSDLFFQFFTEAKRKNDRRKKRKTRENKDISMRPRADIHAQERAQRTSLAMLFFTHLLLLLLFLFAFHVI